MFEADTVIERWEPVFHSRRGDEAATLLFLPLAHVFGRMVQVAAIRGRVKFGHQPQLNAAALLPDLAAFRPTFFLAVPYIFEKVFNAARRKAEKEGRSGPFEKAVEVAVRYAEAVGGEGLGHRPRPLGGAADAAPALRQARLLQGPRRDGRPGEARDVGRLGDGPAARAVLRGRGRQHLRGVRAHRVHGGRDRQPARAHPVRHRRAAHPGHAPCTSRTTARSGCSGANVFQGYLNDPKATDATLHDGWLATGDLGALDEDGYLTITGRKKEILVTSGGKSVSPGDPGGAGARPSAGRAVHRRRQRPAVHRGARHPRLGGRRALAARCADKPQLTPSELVRDPDLETEVRRAVVAANTLVSQAESIRTFRILAHQFTEEHGLLTPSLKLKRKAIENAYAAEVEALYRA